MLSLWRVPAVLLILLGGASLRETPTGPPAPQMAQFSSEWPLNGPLLDWGPDVPDRLVNEAQIEAERLRVEAERVAAEQTARARSAQTAAAASRCQAGCGPHSDAWWLGVAICEQGGRNDPYYGYFSWMDGSAAGMTWDEQVAKSNALLARVHSESPAWAPSCVAAGYRAAPDG